MATVKFPYSVKFNGKHYAPNMPIEVDDVTEFVKKGAIVVDEKKKVGRKPKADKSSETTVEVKTDEAKVPDESAETSESGEE